MALKLLGIILLVSLQALAGEFAVLSTGSVLHADRHEVDGSTVRLHVNGGVIEFPASLIVGFEPEVKRAPAPAAGKAVAANAKELVDRAARQYGANKEFIDFVHSVAKVESGYRPDAVSPKGAVGIMQLMPGTAQALGANPNDPAQNADAGARYLSELLLKYNGDTSKALAAYNAGPGAVERYKGIPPYRETVQYVEKVLKQYNRAQR